MTKIIPSVETLTGGTADRFLLAGGAGVPAVMETASQVKTRLSISNVDNTSDANKPVSTAQQTALDLKANLASPALTGTPTAPTATGGTNTTQIASTAFVTSAVAAAVTGLLEFQGNIDCSANPDYPAGSKGDTYYVSVAGKIGGASGVTVAVGDAVVCKADNAGGTEASVGTSWFVLEKNLAGALLSANNLSDLADAGTARTNLGLGTLATQSGTFSGTSSGTNTGDQNLFSTIVVSGQSNVVADSTGDTLTLVAGTNITITTDAGTDAITIAASGGGSPGGSSGQVQYNDAGVFGGMTSVVYASGGPHLTVTAQSASYIPVLIVGAASQTASLLKCQTSTGVTAFTVAADGGLVASNSNTQSFFQVFPTGTGSSSLRLYRPSVAGAYFDVTANNTSVLLSHFNGVTASSLQLFPGIGAVFNTNNVGLICGVYGSVSATSLTVQADCNTFRARSGSTLILVGGDAFSTNYAAGPVYVKTGRGTGSGAGSAIYFQGTLPGSSGTTLHSYRDLAELDANTTAGETPLLLLDIDKGTLQRVSIGASDSGGTGFKVLRVPN